MTHPIFRHGLAIAGALLTCAVALPADAGKQVSGPTISVVGVDDVCDSFNMTTDGTGTTLTCVRTGTPPPPPPAGAPTGCIATVNLLTTVTLPQAGGSVNLAVTGCTSSTAITYNWYRNGTLGAASTSSWTDTSDKNPALGQNTTSTDKTTSYQVQACAGTACTTVPTTPLTVIVPGTTGGGVPGPPGGWGGVCPGFTNTRVIPLSWTNPVRQYTSSYGGFGVNDAVVVEFTTGNLSSSSSLPHIVAVEFQSSPSSRIATLSKTPCDFGPQAMPGASTEGYTVTMAFALGTGYNWGYYPLLELNTKYYVNIKNNANPVCAANNNCNMSIDLLKSNL